MAEAFASLRGLLSGEKKVDVPVPACLNQCINQEVFCCKICGEVFNNIHNYITHGKGHRRTSTVCGFCGGVWPSYSSLSIHQLVWENKEGTNNVNKDGEADGGIDACPLNCGVEGLPSPELRTHLVSFHGALHHTIQKNTDGGINVELSGPSVTCPKCETKISKEKVGLETHLGFHCLKRSCHVKQRIQEVEEQATSAGEEPLLLLIQEIDSLIFHLTGLLEKTINRENFLSEGSLADRKYNRLPQSFTEEYLSWVPVGYTLQVLKSEKDNFPVVFDVWSQVVDKLAGPPDIQDVCQRLERELTANLGSGLVPRWPSLAFDPAMLDPPDQAVLDSLQKQLGWIKA